MFQQFFNVVRTVYPTVVIAAASLLTVTAVIDADEEKPGVLLLTNGTIARGKLQKVSTGYVVELPKGKFLVPFEQVRYEAIDLVDAYEKQRARPFVPTANDHLALARWCMTYKLYSQARQELNDALKLDDSLSTARRMLKRIGELESLQESQETTDAPRDSQPAASSNDDVRVADVDILDADTSRDFLTKVQPLLQNRCGNASCHGGSLDNGFHLERAVAGSGAYRVRTRENLAAVLAALDNEHPDRSPLLTIPSEPHGSTGTIFAGPFGEEQYRFLRAWVRAAAKDLDAAEKRNEKRRSLLAKRRDGHGTIRQTSGESTSNSLSRLDDEATSSTDAFDPEEFNRLFHPNRVKK